MKYKKEVSINDIKETAEKIYGNYYCTEAIMAVIRDKFELDLPEEWLAMASGFPVGIGGAMCTCGAVTGGVLSLGLFFGRTKPTNPYDPKICKALSLSKELHDWFKDNNGKNTLCCRILTRGMDMNKLEHRGQCAKFTGMIAQKTAEIIVRELGLTNIDEINS